MKKSSIYVIGEADGTMMKIGISADPSTRLRQLQTGYPRPLVVHYCDELDAYRARIIEGFIHSTIGYKRTKGEWFEVSAQEAISEVQYAIMRWESDHTLVAVHKHKLRRI